MAQAHSISESTASGPDQLGFLARIKAHFDRRRVYRRTHAELSALSTAQLEELGISRAMISRMAHEAAYGK